MKIKFKVVSVIGDPFKTQKGGLIQQFLVETKDGVNEIFKVHASSDSISSLVGLKTGDVFVSVLPEKNKFVLLQS